MKIFPLYLLLIIFFSCSSEQINQLPEEQSATKVEASPIVMTANDIDIASDYEYIEMNFMENGKLLWKYKLTGDPTEYNFEGDPEWELATLDEEIKITYFDDNAGDERLLYLNVLRLTADEFWFTYIDNGDRIGIHLNPK